MIREVRGLAKTAQPAAANLRKLLASVRETDGFSNLTELVFNGAGAVNPFDQYGHFIRGLLPTNNCVDYDVVPEASCSANFVGTTTTAAAGPGRDRERQRDRKRGSEQEDAGARQLPQSADGQAFEVTPEGLDLEPGELDVDAAPAVPEAAPETAQPTAGQMRATRDLLDFLIGARPADRRSKTRGDDGGER